MAPESHPSQPGTGRDADRADRLDPSRAKWAKAQLRAFARRSRRRRSALERHFSPSEVDDVIVDATERYEHLLPEMALVPGGLLNGALKSTYELLAYSMALRARQLEVEKIGDFFEESYLALIGRFPRVLLRSMFRIASPLLARRLRREAIQSAGAGQGGWRFDFVDAVPGSHDLGFDVKSCAVCDLFARHGHQDVVPYVCALDDTMSEVVGMGLRRSGTRAMGAACCDFRYRAGGEARTLRSIRSFPVVDQDS